MPEKSIKQIVLAFLAIVGITAFAGCTLRSQQRSSSDSHLLVFVSIQPQQYFLDRIGGDLVDVSVMVEPGASPETYEPKPQQMQQLTSAVAFFSIGVPYEQAWLPKIRSSNQNMEIIDTSSGIEKMQLAGSGNSGTLDPHIWLSPHLVKVQADAIYQALIKLDPAHQSNYQANYEAFVKDIDSLDTHITDTLSGVACRTFMTFHPSWGYFARDYDLEMIAIEVEGQEPSAAQLADLIDTAKGENIKVIFASPEFSTRAADAIASEINGTVVLIDPLASDWLANMQQVAQVLAQNLQ